MDKKPSGRDSEVEVDVFANVENKAKKIKMPMTIKTNKTTTAVEKSKKCKSPWNQRKANRRRI